MAGETAFRMSRAGSITADLFARSRLDTHSRLLLVIGGVIFVLMSLAMPEQFPTAANLESMAFQMSELGILTVAMALAMVIGGIDLSVTAMANLSAIAAGMVLVRWADPAAPASQLLPVIGLAFMTAAAVGFGCGLVNGLLIGRFGVPAILATLATLTLYTGLAFGITGGRAVHGFPDPVLFIGIGTVLGLPVPLVIFLAAAAAASVLLNRTSYGFRVFMLGSNPVAARFSGIDNAAITLRTHVLAGVLSAVTGIVTLARTNSANADYGSAYLLMTILIAVLGGVAVTGGSGRMVGIVLAVAVLQMLSTGFNALLTGFGGSNFFRDFAWGFLLLFVMVLTRIRRRHGQGSRRFQ